MTIIVNFDLSHGEWVEGAPPPPSIPSTPDHNVQAPLDRLRVFIFKKILQNEQKIMIFLL